LENDKKGYDTDDVLNNITEVDSPPEASEAKRLINIESNEDPERMVGSSI